MLELRSGIVRYKGSSFFYIRSSAGRCSWIDAATNMSVPDCTGHLLDYHMGTVIGSIRSSSSGDGASGDSRLAAPDETDPRIVDANDAIAGRDVQNDIHYQLALDDVEELTGMGSADGAGFGYAGQDDVREDDPGEEFPIEMVA